MRTIKAKLSAFFIVCLAFVGVLSFFYYENISRLEERLITVERFDDLIRDILELRRYEKNYLLYRNEADLRELQYYLERTEALFRALGPKIKATAGPTGYNLLLKRLKRYKESLQLNLLLIREGKSDPARLVRLRERGKALVEQAQRLVHMERERVRRALRGIMTIPMGLVGLFVLVVVLIFRVIAVRILRPLALVEKATASVAREEFKPIPYTSTHQDEVSQLIAAFNRMAEELEARQAQLLQSRKMASLGILTSGVAHELNNPLNNISLTAETLLYEHRYMSVPELESLFREIMEQAERGSEVVRKLLEFSRVEPGAQMRELDIVEVVERTLRLVRNQLMISGIELATSYEQGLGTVKGKRQELEQAFLNILINAIQAMPDGGRLEVKVRRAAEGMVRVDITDTGVGIKQEHLAHIFDPFFTTKPVGQGTGLGLSLTYGIIRAHGGYIEVSSEVGKGTTFSIFLPVAGGEEVGEGDGQTVQDSHS